MTPPGQILSARDVAARGKRPFRALAGFSPFPPGGSGPGEALLRFLGRESGGDRKDGRTGGRRDRKDVRIEGSEGRKKERMKERKNERKRERKGARKKEGWKERKNERENERNKQRKK